MSNYFYELVTVVLNGLLSLEKKKMFACYKLFCQCDQKTNITPH